MIAESLTAISEVISIAQKGADNLDNQDRKNLKNILGSPNSISKMAKGAFRMYPTIISASLVDDDNIFKIIKYLELQYGAFTLMSVGLDPTVVKGNTIGSHVNSVVGTESYDFNDTGHIEFVVDSEAELEPALKKVYEAGFDIYNFGVSTEAFKDDVSDDIEKYRKETGDKRRDSRAQNRIHDRYMNGKTPSGIGGATLDNKSGKSGTPTMIALKVFVEGHEHTINIGIKAVPHIVSNGELTAIFDYGLENSRRLHRVLQLTTGEISFFRDFILHMDRAKRDEKLYKKLGRHPWFKALEDRKGKSKFFSTISIAFKMMFGKGVNSPLPVCTIICTKEQMVSATGLNVRKVLFNTDKKITKILDRMMLLGIIIYDADAEAFTSHFSGLNEPMYYRMSELRSSTDDTLGETLKLMRDMLRKF